MAEKGCDEILEAAKLLNEWGMQDRYIVDFYGKVADDFRTTFEEGISQLSNVKYQGFLDMRQKEGYDKLATYDIWKMKQYCQIEAKNYDVRNIISEELLREIELYD